MNISISEKNVNLRIKNKDSYVVHEQIGAYIKKERVAQGLRQDYVCKGICSVSYYSRIENSEAFPDNDYIERIFKRLNKPIPKEYKTKNKELIDNFISAIEYKNESLINDLYYEIKKTQPRPELYDLVYYIINNKNDEAEVIIKLLYEQQRYLDNDEFIIFLEMIASYFINKFELNKAEKFLCLALKLQSVMNVEKPLIYYKYAWVLGKRYKDTKCIYYAKRAKNLFKIANNSYRVIQCQMLIAIKLSIKYYEKSLSLYEEISKLSLNYNYHDLYKVANFNLIQLYKRYNYFMEAKTLSRKMIVKYQDDIHFVQDLYIELIDILICEQKIDEALDVFEILKNTNPQTKKTSLFQKYFDQILFQVSKEERLKAYKSDFIPYANKNHNVLLEIRFRKEYCILLETNNLYKEIIDENKKIIDLLEIEKKVNFVIGG